MPAMVVLPTPPLPASAMVVVMLRLPLSSSRLFSIISSLPNLSAILRHGGLTQRWDVIIDGDAQPVGFLHSQIGRQQAQHRQPGRFACRKAASSSLRTLLPTSHRRCQANVIGQFFDLGGSAQAAAGRFDDDDHGIDEIHRRPAQVLDPGVHIQDQHIVLAEQQVGEQRLEHGAFGADTARAADVHRAHFQQAHVCDACTLKRSGISSTRGLMVKKPPTVPGLGPGAFLDQCVHLSDRVEPGAQLRRETQCAGQAGRRVGVHRQHLRRPWSA